VSAAPAVGDCDGVTASCASDVDLVPSHDRADLTGGFLLQSCARGKESLDSYRLASDRALLREASGAGLRRGVGGWTRILILWACLGAALAASLASAAAAEARGMERARASRPAHPSSAAPSDFARRIKIRGGRRLYLECSGSGFPTVVLEAGSGNNARVWHAHDPGRPAIFPAVARFTGVCAYDRPGTVWPGGPAQPKSVGRSDPVAMPRTAVDIVGDLHALLRAAHVRGPYVLVGHSFGGMVVRLYATTYPSEVAGLVSIDAQSEWYAAALKSLLTRQQYTDAVVYQQPPPGFDSYSDYEQLSLDASGAEMRQAQADTPLRPMPLVVLSHSLTDPNPFGFPPDWPTTSLNRAFNASQDKLAALVPGARHVIASRSGHYIQLDQPKLVIDAIRSVVEQARRHDR
jgi:pimeloyl-ACP methyl ester carboxylesterase